MGLFSFLFGGNKKKKEPSLADQLAPFLQQYTDIANKYSGQADTDYSKASLGYDEAMQYYKTLLGGSRADLLKNLDASALTAATDEQERQNYELAPRGGRRAATAMNLGFDKLSQLNAYLQQLRGAAPGQIANLAQAYANMAQGKLSAAMGGTAGASNLLFGTEQIKQQEADRRTSLIGSIFGAIGSVAGAVIGCNTFDTWILTPDRGYIQLKDIRVGDRVSTMGVGGLLEEAKIIRKEILENQDIYELVCEDTALKGTLSHVVVGSDNPEYDFKTLQGILTEIPIYKNDDFEITKTKTFRNKKVKEDVAILKLNNENKNYNYITNGIISIDADCLR